MKKISEQIGQLAVKQQQIAARLTNLRNRQERIDYAKETRRLVLAGKWMLKLNGSDWEKVGQRLIEAGIVVSARDKALFNAQVSKSNGAGCEGHPASVTPN
jgi:hypothetical protein